MNKEFVPYEEALALKELGFDEPCFGYYVGLGDNKETPFKLIEIQSEREQFKWVDNVCHAPLYQQAFRWFRKPENGSHNHLDFMYEYLKDDSKRYEEAELACLRKLIEIVKITK